MTPAKKSATEKKNITTIRGDVVDSVIVTGDNNQTFFQKIINYIFPSEKETLEHRNRRILLGHVENAWIKGVLDASLHGAALLDLGIKQDLEAVTQYPWAIKKESTDETLPAGLSMLEIFDSIGMGRSLLILGAPGSGKTTMLLELTRGLIAHAREDVTQPIPMVFNLASWTEKLSLTDWLIQELNNLYSVPRKTAPDWVKGNKLLLLLDGLDEVRQESRAKCVEAINEFRKQNGLTSLAACSRSQDYADLKAKLAFEGAIEIQPLTQEQIAEFFNRFGNEMAGIKQALGQDTALRETAETPLFLSIMMMAYQGKQDVDILTLQDLEGQRRYLFDSYIEKMFERSHSQNAQFIRQNVLRWLSRLASKMVKDKISFGLHWLDMKMIITCFRIVRLLEGLLGGLLGGLFGSLFGSVFNGLAIGDPRDGIIFTPFIGLIVGLVVGLFFGLTKETVFIHLTERWEWNSEINMYLLSELPKSLGKVLVTGLYVSAILGVLGRQSSLANRLSLAWNWETATEGMYIGLLFGLLRLLFIFLSSVGSDLFRQNVFSFVLARDNLLPWRLVPFLDHCVDLIFLRRVGGGYIFVHRLLMEHFAEMYVEPPTSKGN